MHREDPLTVNEVVEDRHIDTFMGTNENKMQLDSAQFL